jgi:hypothetical protein
MFQARPRSYTRPMTPSTSSGFKTRVRRGSCRRTAPPGARPKAVITGVACGPGGAPRSASPAYRVLKTIPIVLLLLYGPTRAQEPAIAPPSSGARDQARANGVLFEQSVAACQRLLHVWLTHADPRTLLLPDRIDVDHGKWIYTPHNSGADLYPYLVLTAQLTDPDLYQGRMMEMLRNEVRFTSAKASVPANLTFATGELGPPSLFGAGEYAKDGLVAVTEYLGRTPWFHRMVDLTADAMSQAATPSRFGLLPASDPELNGDYLQTLVRLAAMTGDHRFLEWARRIGEAYVEEALPGNFGVPGMKWDFTTHMGERRLRLRDHGNETVVGLTLLYALEHQLASEYAQRDQPAVKRMLDRILQSANPDGMLYNDVDAETLQPVDKRLSDNWGYVYGAVYTYYQITGETNYRDAVRRVLANLPKYRRYVWEPRDPPANLPLGSFDGYADSIESAIYLVNREAVREAFDWIDSEMQVMLGMQRADGHIEDWYGEGNFNRTALLYAYMKSLGVRPERWDPGVRVGAARDGNRLIVSLTAPAARRIQFDFARHRRVMNFAQNYVRLNEFPEWFTLDENTLYRIGRAGTPADIRLGSELIAGISLDPGEWIIEAVKR